MKYLISFIVLICTSTAIQAQSYNDWLEKYFVYMSIDSLSAAEDALIKAMRVEPGNIQNGLLLSNLGTIQRRLGKKEKALESYNAAISFLPNSTTLYMNRAALYTEIDSIKNAIDDYSHVLLLDQDDENVYYLRGLLRIEAGDTIAAQKDFETILTRKPFSGIGRAGMATLYKAKGEYNKAIPLYNDIIKANPRKAVFYSNRAEAYFLDKKYSRAMNDINKAIELENNNSVFYLLRGKIKLATFEKVSALKDFDKAVSLGMNKSVIDKLLK